MNLEEIEKELEDIPLTEYEWDMIEWLIAEVKRLRRQIAKKDKENERLKLLLEQAISIIESSVLDPSWPEVLAQKSCNKKWIERVSDEFGRD